MKLYCSECYNEIEGDSVLVVLVLGMPEGENTILVPKVPLQKFCMACAAELSRALQGRFNGQVDEKLGALICDFQNFLHDETFSGVENVIAYLRDGVNLYFGYDIEEQKFFEGELIQCWLITAEEAHALPENTWILENIPNHVFVTLQGAAFTMQDGGTHLKLN